MIYHAIIFRELIKNEKNKYTLQGHNVSFYLKGIYGCENASYDLLKYRNQGSVFFAKT
jgi:hypothetical protein